ncbi:MAG: M1 family aminopeptidase [Pseudomonadota bacterium]|nr:M1 family aminopeptidase [Pseudomonadota bacterium]
MNASPIPKSFVHRLLAAAVVVPAFFGGAAADSDPVVAHDMTVSLDPVAGLLTVEDTLDLGDAAAPRFTLRCGLMPRLDPREGRLEAESGCRDGETARVFRLFPGREGSRLTLRYDMRLDSTGTASIGEVLHLSGADYWYPSVEGSRSTFRLEVHTPPGWTAVSQGRNLGVGSDGSGADAVWREDNPQEDIHLVAGRFQLYEDTSGEVDTQVYLIDPDPALARRYLDASKRYIRRYERLLGDYPYAKFALVENDRPTGYGMPSFTLLGARVLRLPFIIDSSYPHEILHDWWGNGVYVDISGGNWSEALTTYLADHLQKESQGRGAEYRRETLGRYADYVSEGEDFPLNTFTSRHNDETQAVGYGKGMMVFHMLRRQLGDGPFIEGLRRFYRDHVFEAASYDDLRRSMESASGGDLVPFFSQWLNRTGAPILSVDDVGVRRLGAEWTLGLTLNQVQQGPAYDLRVPVSVTLENRVLARESVVDMRKKSQRVEISFPARPLRVDVDPDFDLFRRLDQRELPPTLGQVFGANNLLIILPSPVKEGASREYGALAAAWQRRYPGSAVVFDREIDAMPDDRPVWILGRENRFAAEIDQWVGENDGFDDILRAASEPGRSGRASVVLAARRDHQPDITVGKIAVDDVVALAGLARKLPHYGAYGYLLFEGPEPRIVMKGRWSSRDSPLGVSLDPGNGGVTAAGRGARQPLGEHVPAPGKEKAGAPDT